METRCPIDDISYLSSNLEIMIIEMERWVSSYIGDLAKKIE
jgi:hypothetical protein